MLRPARTAGPAWSTAKPPAPKPAASPSDLAHAPSESRAAWPRRRRKAPRAIGSKCILRFGECLRQAIQLVDLGKPFANGHLPQPLNHDRLSLGRRIEQPMPPALDSGTSVFGRSCFTCLRDALRHALDLADDSRSIIVTDARNQLMTPPFEI